jgi:hypothetical protein
VQCAFNRRLGNGRICDPAGEESGGAVWQRNTGTPVSYDYTPPFAFKGTLKEVVVDLGK